MEAEPDFRNAAFYKKNETMEKVQNMFQFKIYSRHNL
jgi:hypothetical protein